MRLIHLEDSAIKRAEINRILEDLRVFDVVWVKNMEDGQEAIKKAIADQKPFDLAITDMNYPLASGESSEVMAGEHFMDWVKKEGLSLPIIVCSSINYDYPGVWGNVWYQPARDWESDMRDCVKRFIEKNA